MGLTFTATHADNIQIYFSTPSTSVFPPPTLANCIKELKLWLEANYLGFNSDKTEVILIGSKAVVSKHSSQLMNLDVIWLCPPLKFTILVFSLIPLFHSTITLVKWKRQLFSIYVISLVIYPLSVSRMLKMLYMLCYVTIRLLWLTSLWPLS